MPGPEKIQYGGVTFNKSDVKTIEHTKNYIGEEDKSGYKVELKDGTIFTFSKDTQKKENNPQVYSKDNQVVFEGINNANVYDNEPNKANSYLLKGCQNIFVDSNTVNILEGENVQDIVIFQNGKTPKGKKVDSKNNYAKMSFKDKQSGVDLIETDSYKAKGYRHPKGSGIF